MTDDALHRRLLIVADDDVIHGLLRRELQPSFARVGETAGALLAKGPDLPGANVVSGYEIDTAASGEKGVELVHAACDAGDPYAVIFIDVPRASESDSLKVANRLHRIDPQLHVVLCTPCPSEIWPAVLNALGAGSRLSILQKPFDSVALQQLTCTLTHQWNEMRTATAQAAEFEQAVFENTNLLAAANDALHEQIHTLAAANARLAEELNARQQADDQIRHIAFHDPLTDLPNRMLLMERVDSCIERSCHRPDYCFAVLYCDLDNFKLVNDALGHRTGDQLLIQVAQKLKHTLRTASDNLRPAYDTVARLSGDEFVILLDEVPDARHVLDIAERVKESILQPIQVEENKLVLGISIGVAISTGEYNDAIELLRDADTALYHAKGRGRGCIAVFDQDMRDKATARLDLETDLRGAIERSEFEVFYQPIVCLNTGRVASLEALVRWNHPRRGLLAPGTFIAVAEETGVIDAIGQFVLAKSLEQVARWRNSISGMESLGVSVNLSPRQLAHRNVVECIDRCLAQFELDPHALRLEIAEAATIHDLPKMTGMLAELVARGVEIHLDDFGTGYSSLSVLHTLPFSTIKLDRTFIRHLGESLETSVTVKAVVMLAQNEGIKIVAEGIESHDQLAMLQMLECEFGQGYYFSRPLPTAEAEAFLRESAASNFSPLPTRGAVPSELRSAEVVNVVR